METYHVRLLERLLPYLKETSYDFKQTPSVLVRNQILSQEEMEEVNESESEIETLTRILKTKSFKTFMRFYNTLRKIIPEEELIEDIAQQMEDLKEKFERTVEEIAKFCNFSFELLDFLVHIAEAIDENSAVKLMQYFGLESKVGKATTENGYEFVKCVCTTNLLMPAGISKMEMAAKELELTSLLNVFKEYESRSHGKEFYVMVLDDELISDMQTQSNTHKFPQIGKRLNEFFRREYFGTSFIKFHHRGNSIALRIPSDKALSKLCSEIISGKLASMLPRAFGLEKYKNCKMYLTFDETRREQIQEQYQIGMENDLLCQSMQEQYDLINKKFQLLIRREIKNGCLAFYEWEAAELLKAASYVETIQSKTNFSLACGSVVGIAGGAAVLLGLLTPISPLVVTAGTIAGAAGGIASLSSSVSQSVTQTRAKGEKEPLLEKIRDLVHIVKIVLNVYAVFFPNTGIPKKLVKRYKSVCYEYTVHVHCTIDDIAKDVLAAISSEEISGIQLFQNLNESVNKLVKSMKDIGITDEDLIFAKDDFKFSRHASIKYIRDVCDHLTNTGLIAALNSKYQLEGSSKAEKLAISKVGTKQAGLMSVKASSKANAIAARGGAAGKLTSEVTENAATAVAGASAKVFKVLGLSLTVAGIAFDTYALGKTVKNLSEGSKTDISNGFRELGKLVTDLVALREEYPEERNELQLV